MRLCHMSLAVALLAVSGLACADVVQMPPAAAATQSAPTDRPLVQIALPVRGMTMREVERKYGAPQEKIPPVGRPPISRWVYKDYTVYFEYQYVIDSVVKRK